MRINWPAALTLIFFLLGSVPLVLQDLRSMSVSQTGVFLVLAGWAALAWWLGQCWACSAALSAGVLSVGALLLLILPDSLGEGDIVYMAALAWLLPFWSFLFALCGACVLGFAAFAWQRPGPLPFLPCLALGALGSLGGFL